MKAAVTARGRALRRRPATYPRAGLLEVVAFSVGKYHFVVPRDAIAAIRPSLRVKMLMTGALQLADIPILSLSAVLGIERDTSVDRRVFELDYWGQRLGLEVTGITGIRAVDAAALRPLPPVVARHCSSRNVLGIVEVDGVQAVALDLLGLLVEKGVDVPR